MFGARLPNGREVHGQPKKFANPSLEFRGDLIVGRVERNGIDMLIVTTPYKQVRADPAEMRADFTLVAGEIVHDYLGPDSIR